MNPNQTPSRSKRFEVFEMALLLIRELRAVMPELTRRDAELADRIRRAASSAPPHISEGRGRSDREPPHPFHAAAGSVSAVASGLQVAVEWGYLEEKNTIQARECCDRILAMLWRLTRARG